MKLSAQLLESTYRPPSPSELSRKLKTQKRARGKVLTTLGEGPPYRVVGIDMEKLGTVERPLPCDHCQTMLRAKQVHIEDKEGQEFIIGSSCAKKLGGEKLARWVKHLEEQQALEALKTTIQQHRAQLEAIPYGEIADRFPYGKHSAKTISAKQRMHRNRGLKKTAYTWAWDMLNATLNQKEKTELAKAAADPEHYISR